MQKLLQRLYGCETWFSLIKFVLKTSAKHAADECATTGAHYGGLTRCHTADAAENAGSSEEQQLAATRFAGRRDSTSDPLGPPPNGCDLLRKYITRDQLVSIFV